MSTNRSQMDLASSVSQDMESNTTSRGRRGSVWPIQGSKRGLFTALTFGVVLMVLVISAAVYASSGQGTTGQTGGLSALDFKNESVVLNDILTGKFLSRPFNATWISDTECQYFSPSGDLMLYNAETDKASVLISSVVFSMILQGKRPFMCTISADRNFVLIATDSQKIYRYSFFALFMIFDLTTKAFEPLRPMDDRDVHLQLVQWSPVGNAIAFVHANDIYYRQSAKIGTMSQRITRDGSNVVYNGVTDWVYEEEMFSNYIALWFSPSGSNLAFVTFNDTEVDLIQFPLYGEPHNPFQYPMMESIPYPKSGRQNPDAKVSIVKLPTEKASFELGSPLRFAEVPPENYVASVAWASDSELLVVSMNRHQSQIWMHLCDTTNMCRQFYTITQANGWIEVNNPFVSTDGQRLVMLTAQKQKKYSYRHILMIDRNSTSKQITKGEFALDSILGWDEPNKNIYFTATKYDAEKETADPSQTHLYVVKESGENMTCITCDLRNVANETCHANSVEMSKAFTYFAQSCNGPNVPDISIRHVQTGKSIKQWVANTDLRSRLEFVGLPIARNYDIPTADGFTIKARVLLPHNFDSSRKYPLLVDVYGGPGSQKITQRFSIDWGTSLVSSKGIIYAYFDGRGSGRQSDDLMFQLYRRLGTVEVEDQINGAKWLIENTGFIDPNRTAIWGWSYGGFATAMVLGTDPALVYKCGISVAPVTSWKFYDTIYTERFMGLPGPNDNFEGYNNSDIVNHLEGFRHKKYYLIHGNADDNVHYQQSMILARALEKADILFRQQSYPDENHGLGGVRKHLYHSLEKFLFEDCYG